LQLSGSFPARLNRKGTLLPTQKREEEIAMNRYKTCLVGYLDVLSAQTTLLSNERVAVQISGQRMVATVVLVKALGGGWLGVPA
jgi:multidrug efflux system outer membrane protein